MVKFFFGYLAFAVIFLSILVVRSRNAVHSVLWMLLMFLHVAGLYLLLNAEFLAAVQVIVYAGAILVLFLFVIMLLNHKEEIRAEHFVGGWPAGLSLVVALLVVMMITAGGFSTTFSGKWDVKALEETTHTKALGELLYTEYLLPFEVASIILLVGIVGAIVLAKKRIK